MVDDRPRCGEADDPGRWGSKHDPGEGDGGHREGRPGRRGPPGRREPRDPRRRAADEDEEHGDQRDGARGDDDGEDTARARREETERRPRVAPVRQRVDRPVEGDAEAEVEPAQQDDAREGDGAEADEDPSKRRPREEQDAHGRQRLERHPGERRRRDLRRSRGEDEGEVDDEQGECIRPEPSPRPRQPALPGELVDLGAEGDGEGRSGSGDERGRDGSGEEPGQRGAEGDRLGDGDRLAPRRRGDGVSEPRHDPGRSGEEVAGGAEEEHPGAEVTGDADGEDEDEEGVGLHVEAGAPRGRRRRAAREPAVDAVEDEGDGHDGRERPRPEGEGSVRPDGDADDDRETEAEQRTSGRHAVRRTGDEGRDELNHAGSPCVSWAGFPASGMVHGDTFWERLGFMSSERAFWVVGPGRGELRPVEIGDPGPGEVRVRALRSGVSRGTETLVLRGDVPPSVAEQMRAPFQEGDFPWPVKYGYLSVGVVEAGDPDLVGRTVFCLHPHQSAYVVPRDAVHVVPEGVPPERAVLAGTVETAVNAVWDAAVTVGDRVAVVGGGMVGLCVTRLLALHPAVEVTLVDPDPARRAVAAALGASAASPQEAPHDLDLVVHASATSAGLALALDLLAPDSTVVELSWYGEGSVTLPLGGAFHQRRLTIRGSQVGTVSPTRAARRTYADRMRIGLRLLEDPAFDLLLGGPSSAVGAAGPAAAARLRRARVDLPRHHLRGRHRLMYSVTVSDHMLVAHSLPGEVFGPAQRLHGATYVVEACFRRGEVDDDGIVLDIGAAGEALHAVVADLSYRNLDDDPSLAGIVTTTERLARIIADRLVDRLATGPLETSVAALTELEVTLRESPVAWASYTRTW